VYTNDTQHPVSQLTVTGPVKKFANISPARVVLNGEVGETPQVTVKISPVTQGLFEITGAKADKGNCIHLTLTDPKKGDGTVYTLVVENTKQTRGTYRDLIRLFTTNDAQKEIVIPVWGNIRPPQMASIRPRHVALHGPAGKPIKGSVMIVPKDKHPFFITEVKAQSGKYIQWNLQETGESGKKTYTLTIENRLKEKGRYYDAVFLKTDSKDLPQIRIGVTGRITD